MLPAPPIVPQADHRRLLRAAWPTGLAALALVAGAPPALAQDGDADAPRSKATEDSDRPQDDLLTTQLPPLDRSGAPDAPSSDRAINFEADTLSYDANGDVVTASGNVVLRSKDRSVRADQVTWNRKTGEIVGTGDVRFVDEDGNQLYTSRIELTDKFEAGAMQDLLLALREGGRLAARSGERGEDGTVVLEDAAYTACAVSDESGCAKNPSWRITAQRVTYDPKGHRVRFRGAMLELFGARLLPLPGLTVRTDGKAISGFLVPDIRFSQSNGVELSGRYYWRIDDNKDATLGAYVFSKAPPMAYGQWRQLTDKGAYQITAYGTESTRVADFSTTPTTQNDLRGYVFANGKFQFDPHWSLTGSIRVASDRTFLRRYDISYDDRLRSMLNLERIDDNSYLSIAGWATQTLRIGVSQGQVPLALPVIDYRRRFDDPAGLGGTLQLQLNSLNIMRSEGQDTQRAFAAAQWDLKRMTPLGQVFTLTALARGDVYHSDGNGLTTTAIYRGNPGWETRGIALAALDIQWPFVGRAFGGTQILTPRVQLVAAPSIRNLAVPNEDSRALDLEDSNLFALNRFPGYDRVEDGTRFTYGLDYELQIPDWRIRATIGQSYRFDSDPGVLIDGTGLSERVSDFVGRTEVRYKDFIKFTHRFRLDKDGLAVRRNEVDATIGSKGTYVEAGYLRLNRNIAAGIEDLQNREELRLATRVAFARYWSVFGAGVFNLTDRNEDPTLTSDGFQPIRTRLGVAYQDDCIELGLTWRRDYTDQGDAQRGDTFQFYFALKNLGFR